MDLNKHVVVFEAALVIGLFAMFIEKWVVLLNINFYLKVALIMLFFGGLFSFVFKILELLVKWGLYNFMKLEKNKTIVNIAAHLIMFIILFILYAWFYFGKIVD